MKKIKTSNRLVGQKVKIQSSYTLHMNQEWYCYIKQSENANVLCYLITNVN
jgi:hypothetical protein